jgi:hypothetical protein
MSHDERSMYGEVIMSVILSKKKIYIYVQVSYSERFPSFEIVDKIEIFCTVSNTVIYCSSNRSGTL